MKKEKFLTTNNLYTNNLDDIDSNALNINQSPLRYKVFIQQWPIEKRELEPPIEMVAKFKKKSEALEFIYDIYVRRSKDYCKKLVVKDYSDELLLNIIKYLRDHFVSIALYDNDKLIKEYEMYVYSEIKNELLMRMIVFPEE